MMQQVTQKTTEPRARPALRYFLIALAIVPPALITWLVYLYGVNVPFWDDWNNSVALHLKYLRGELNFGSFWFQVSEHRPALVRLIGLVSDILTHGDRRALMFVSVLSVCVTSVLLYRLMRRTIPRHALWMIAIVNWLLFSPVQHENWLWGIQLLMFLPITFFISALLLICGDGSWTMKTLGGITLCVLAVMCFATGFIFWPIVAGVQLASHGVTRRSRFLAASAWVAALVLTCALYFHHYDPSPAPLMPELMLVYPEAATGYITGYFGAPFQLTGSPGSYTPVVGAIVIACSFLVLSKFNRRQALFRQMLPWIAIALFALLTDLSAVSARLRLGWYQAQSSRYTTFSILLPIATLVLWTITFVQWKRSIQWTLIAIGVGLLSLHLLTSLLHISRMRVLRDERLGARDALQRINIDDQDPAIDLLYPDRAKLKTWANEYARYGLLRPMKSSTRSP